MHSAGSLGWGDLVVFSLGDLASIPLSTFPKPVEFFVVVSNIQQVYPSTILNSSSSKGVLVAVSPVLWFSDKK